jgi:hypothetical protein
VTLAPASSIRGGFPLGLAGATAATRYVGATASGAPASGTFAVGDFAIDQSGSVYVCTVAGSPGTWVQVGGTAVTWATYAPTLGASVTPPTLGVGSASSGRWVAVGKLAVVQFKFTFGSSGTNAGSGTYQPSLPFTVDANQLSILGGSAICEDASLGDDYSFVAYGVAGQAFAQCYSAQTTTSGLVTHAYPFAWAASDTFAGTVICEQD